MLRVRVLLLLTIRVSLDCGALSTASVAGEAHCMAHLSPRAVPSPAIADAGWDDLVGVRALDGSPRIGSGHQYLQRQGQGTTAENGSLKRLRPVSFTLREHHGGRILGLAQAG